MPKKTVFRMCILSRKILPREKLLRIVRRPNGQIVFDPDSNVSGRGMHISNDSEIVQQLFSEKKKGIWKHALQCDISAEARGKLHAEITAYLSKNEV